MDNSSVVGPNVGDLSAPQRLCDRNPLGSASNLLVPRSANHSPSTHYFRSFRFRYFYFFLLTFFFPLFRHHSHRPVKLYEDASTQKLKS